MHELIFARGAFVFDILFFGNHLSLTFEVSFYLIFIHLPRKIIEHIIRKVHSYKLRAIKKIFIKILFKFKSSDTINLILS